MVSVHSSDPITPYLALWARVPGFEAAHLTDALCGPRSLWRLHAMRRTLWIVARDAAPIFLAATSQEVAAKERRRVLKQLEPAAENPAALLAQVQDQVLQHLASVGEASTRELSAALPLLQTQVTNGSGKWAARGPLSSRLLVVLAMEGRIVRTRAEGSWRSSQYRWAVTEAWFDGIAEAVDPLVAEVELVRRYAKAFGPVTEADVKWWTGWTLGRTQRALSKSSLRRVRLEAGTGYVPYQDEVPADAQGAALLPGLDPVTMGWKERGFYLGPHARALFDRNGNAGPTVWWRGRIVGGWGQNASGEVVYRLLDDIGAEGRACVDAQVEALQAWLGDTVITPRFRAPLERELAAG
jgi:hypothetical protein